MIEFDVDMGYLLEAGELDSVVLNDENGEHEPMTFYPNGGKCELAEVDSYSNANEVIHVLECSACGETCEHVNGSYPKCPHCGRKAVKR